MNLDTRTFHTILAAEVSRPQSTPTRAFGRALSLMGFLSAIASSDKRPLRVAEASYYRHKASLRAAGIVPASGEALSSEALAQLAGDLGLDNPTALARLLWTLDTDRLRSLDGVAAHYRETIKEALSLLGF
jgi:hypothetical protein